MKKLMVMMAAVAAAVAANAASVTWTVSDGGLKDANNNTANGLFCVGFFADQYTVDQAVELLAAGFPDALAGANQLTVNGGGNVMVGAAERTFTPGDYTGFIIMTDVAFSESFNPMTDWNVTKYSVIQGGVDGTRTVEATTSSVNFSFTSAQQGDWQSVPEPTSGLLLLLGVAGLALRRRRA